MSALAPIVYALCFATSALCAFLLIRAYLRQREPMLVWTGLCFLFLALNNLTVFVDIILLPNIDLILLRHALNLAAVAVLLYGFIWESE